MHACAGQSAPRSFYSPASAYLPPSAPFAETCVAGQLVELSGQSFSNNLNGARVFASLTTQLPAISVLLPPLGELSCGAVHNCLASADADLASTLLVEGREGGGTNESASQSEGVRPHGAVGTSGALGVLWAYDGVERHSTNTTAETRSHPEPAGMEPRRGELVAGTSCSPLACRGLLRCLRKAKEVGEQTDVFIYHAYCDKLPPPPFPCVHEGLPPDVDRKRPSVDSRALLPPVVRPCPCPRCRRMPRHANSSPDTDDPSARSDAQNLKTRLAIRFRQSPRAHNDQSLVHDAGVLARKWDGCEFDAAPFKRVHRVFVAL
ncbi:uncharacterized protein PHACADRAFT_251132 [Phanerochaete carnosa HHB-10118-sp]|uniref:Uncharacterized protein n=1 Tax=Phanerochaete carnosa (strain HHB-10118-sp) TaxID=650164 RepID=K5WDW1_PHACS|nr:uncharacterized protein PHACADRAFT_251132 [Phanerochaete carnosa HHB-10118-sp]EKM57470.1 hypothetical protein PHACADRAFT_251132 [Phanerochaete carnosa HHB-10118-sp]